MTPNSRRWWWLAATVTVMGLGLASRRFPGFLPILFGKYPGDVLWATMVFFGLRTAFYRKPVVMVATYALVASCMIELLKLYRAPWILSIHRTTLGHLVFGHVFSWQNLIAYTAGIAIGVAAERVISAYLQPKKSVS